MSPKSATVLVVGMWGILVAAALIKAQPGSTYRKVWGASLAATALAFAADLVPELVGPFALLILLVVVEKNYGLLSGAAGIAPAPAKSAPAKAVTHITAVGP